MHDRLFPYHWRYRVSLVCSHYTDAVTNLRVTPGSHSFEVNFDLPSDYANDGVFGGIYVSCLSESYADNNTFWGQLESINFTGLFSFSHYSCCVIPQWVTSGNGPPVCFEEYTLQHCTFCMSVNKNVLNP